MGTLETSKAPVENIPLPVASSKITALEVLLAVEVVATERVTTAEHVSIETTQGKVARSEVIITTLTSVGNDCSVLNSANIFYIRC